MYYQLIRKGKKKVELLESYERLRSAENKIVKSYGSDSNIHITCVPHPADLTIGFRFYDSTGTLYGTIVNETNSIFIVKRNGKDDEAFYLKSDFIDKFIKGYFLMNAKNLLEVDEHAC